MEKPPEPDFATGHDVDVSAEPTVLRLETLDAIESAITHDALHGETLDQHHAAQTAFLRSLLKKFDAGKFEPNPADGEAAESLQEARTEYRGGSEAAHGAFYRHERGSRGTDPFVL